MEKGYGLGALNRIGLATALDRLKGNEVGRSLACCLLRGEGSLFYYQVPGGQDRRRRSGHKVLEDGIRLNGFKRNKRKKSPTHLHWKSKGHLPFSPSPERNRSTKPLYCIQLLLCSVD